MKNRYILAITGASGSPYAKRLFDLLIDSGADVDVVLSEIGKQIWEQETECDLSYFSEQGATVHEDTSVFANIASGSQKWNGMIIIPASMGTVGRVASGISDSLITRTADITMKEKRKLIIVFRETPLSGIHLENLVRLDRAGALILPASPGFYQKPTRLEDIVDFIVVRALDQLGIPQTILPSWEP